MKNLKINEVIVNGFIPGELGIFNKNWTVYLEFAETLETMENGEQKLAATCKVYTEFRYLKAVKEKSIHNSCLNVTYKDAMGILDYFVGEIMCDLEDWVEDYITMKPRLKAMNFFDKEDDGWCDFDKGIPAKETKFFGDWTVELNGDMEHKNGYFISAFQLEESNDWILHLLEKTWMNWNNFIPAYFQALTNIGKEYRTERIYYKD